MISALAIILIWSSPGVKEQRTPQPTMAACQDAAAALRLIDYFDGTKGQAECKEVK
jgi:hypothetical protein